jgi:hypothetical protein
MDCIGCVDVLLHPVWVLPASTFITIQVFHVSCVLPKQQSNLQEGLHWELLVLQQAAHYQVVPLVLINLKGCPATAKTQQMVEGIKVWNQVDVNVCCVQNKFGFKTQTHTIVRSQQSLHASCQLG